MVLERNSLFAVIIGPINICLIEKAKLIYLLTLYIHRVVNICIYTNKKLKKQTQHLQDGGVRKATLHMKIHRDKQMVACCSVEKSHCV